MVDTLKEDIGMANTGELRTLMLDRDEWRVHCHAQGNSKEWNEKIEALKPFTILLPPFLI